MAESRPLEESEVITALTGIFDKPRDFELLGKLSSARDNIVRLREYVPLLIKACEKADGGSARRIAERSFAAKSLKPKTRRRIQNLATTFDSKFDQLANSIMVDEGKAAAIPESEIYGDPIANLLKVVDFSPIARPVLDYLADLNGMSPDESLYLSEYLRIKQRSSGMQYLLRTQYCVAVNQIQPILSGLLLLVLRKQQEDSGGTGSRSSLDERVTVLLMQGPAEWKKKLATIFDERILCEAVDWVELDRVWNHRNLFVHRGGFVDASFRKHVSNSPPEGALVELKAEEVYNAFDFVGGVVMSFLLMSASLHFPGIPSTFARIYGNAVVLEDLDKERWWLAEGTARAMLALSSESDMTHMQVNLWLARSSRLGMSSVEDEVSGWDISNLEPIYRLAKLILLRQDRKAIKLMKKLLNNGELTDSEITNLPLFMRWHRDELI